jgi:methionyl-tRNA synthetase
MEKTDSELVNGECPLHPGKQLELRDEENYFFRLSKYQDQLAVLYAKRDLVIPDYRLNEIRAFIENGGLQDFSISRVKEKMPWGIAVPDDQDHVMYVWFDALVNYISTLGWPEDEAAALKYWDGENNMQIAGKDMVRPQACMWQGMLLSAGLPRTAKILIHGFITSNGQKMSKSLGNVIDPIEIVNEYGTEALRYFLLRHIHPTEDSDFTMERFAEAYNADLVNGLGNLTARIMKLAEVYLPVNTEKRSAVLYPQEFQTALDQFDFNKAIQYVFDRVAQLDQKITKTEPFKVIKVDPQKGTEIILELILELYVIAFMLEPFMPQTSITIRQAVETHKKPENMFPRK